MDEGYWGEDSPEMRDSGAEGRGVEGLVEDSVSALLTGVNLSRWDYNDDGFGDRLLILHSGAAQESGAASETIWSHFSELQNPVELGEWTISHYTISSLYSGIGTVVHEMLHQMGALDLYDVHSDLPSSTWKGLGDWDIMASGNWNDNGRNMAHTAVFSRLYTKVKYVGSGRCPNKGSVSHHRKICKTL